MSTENWLLEDLRARASEINVRLQLQQQLVNYALVALAGVSALTASIYTTAGLWICPLALASCLFHLSLAVGYLRHDLMLAYNAQYVVQHVLSPAREVALASRESWAQFTCRKRGGVPGNRMFHMLLALARVSPVVGLALLWFLAAVCLPFFVRYQNRTLLSHPPILGASVSIGVLCIAGFCYTYAVMRRVNKEERALAGMARQLTAASDP